MLLVTATEMRSIDRRAIEGRGVPSLELMEAAGRGVAEEAARLLGDPAGKTVVLLCGRGNNGGDGFVAARHLAAHGAQVRPFIVGEGDSLSPDAAANLERLRMAGVSPPEVRGEGDLAGLRCALDEAALAVDALFGTGLSRAISGIAATVVEMLAEFDVPVVAVDLPSGIHTDTGEILGPAVWAEVTATLGLPKLGLYLYPARSLAGEIVVVDIGLPDDVIAEEGVRRHLFDEEEALEALPVREPDAHKGAAGHVLIVAGSPGLTGAATLAALGAARVGAGLVTVAAPRSLNPILEVKLTEPMTLPVAESEGSTHCRAGLPEILRALEGMQAAAVGPGLSRHPEAEALARELVPALRVPAVLDADGLNAFAGRLRELRGLTAPLIITPHPGEMARLLGCSIGEITRDRLGVAARVAAETGLIVLLKGAPTVVAEPSGEVWVNPTGNAGLATGGSGDVLTGAIVGLLSQGVEPATAARLGAYLHGLAADILADEVGPVGYLAGEVADTLPLAMDELAEGDETPEE